MGMKKNVSQCSKTHSVIFQQFVNHSAALHQMYELYEAVAL